MENISLILSDLDGTLFRNDLSISDFSKQTIRKLQEKGIMFGISTSRALTNASKFLDGISPDVLITNGGGMVIYKGKEIYKCGFTLEETQTLIKSVFKVLGKDAVLSADNEKGLYSNSKEELGDKFWTFNDFSDFNESVMKLCVKTLDNDAVLQIASSIGIEKIDALPFSDIPWYKLTRVNATKERGIQFLSTYLNLPPEKIVAFGDDFNDIGMLRFCGKGIATQNAIDKVKQIADEICLSNLEDGVAKWLEENILSQDSPKSSSGTVSAISR